MIRYRTVVFGALAVAAAAVNNVCYELAIRANRVQGWLIRHRTPVPASGDRNTST